MANGGGESGEIPGLPSSGHTSRWQKRVVWTLTLLALVDSGALLDKVSQSQAVHAETIAS